MNKLMKAASNFLYRTTSGFLALFVILACIAAAAMLVVGLTLLFGTYVVLIVIVSYLIGWFFEKEIREIL